MAAVPVIAAVIGGGVTLFGAHKAAQQQQQAAQQSAQQTAANRQYRQDTLNNMLSGRQTSQYPTTPPPGMPPQVYAPPGPQSQPPDVTASGYAAGQQPRGNGTYTQEGDQPGMFHNADGSVDWEAGTGPAWLQNSPQYHRTGLAPIGQRPPIPDDVAKRGTQDWRDAYAKEQSWIKLNEDAGRTLRDIGEDTTKGGGMSNYMRWGDYKGDSTAVQNDAKTLGPSGGVSPTDFVTNKDGSVTVSPQALASSGGGANGSSWSLGPGVGDSFGGDYGLSGYYGGLLGNAQASSAFLAPQEQALQQQKDGQIQQIMSSMPPGGQRDRAIKQLNDTFTSSLGQLRQGLVPQALSGLQSLYGTQLGAATQKYGIDTNNATQRYGIDQSTGLGYANLGLGYANLGEKQNEFGQNFGLSEAQFLTGADQYDQNFQRQQDWRNQDLQNANYANIGNTISGLAGAYLNSQKSGANTGYNVKPSTQNRVNVIPATNYSFNSPAGY